MKCMAVVSQFNFLRDRGAMASDSAGRFEVKLPLMKEAIRGLTHEPLMIEAEGSYERAKEFLRKYGRVSPELEEALKKVADLPIDIEPDYEVLRKI